MTYILLHFSSYVIMMSKTSKVSKRVLPRRRVRGIREIDISEASKVSMLTSVFGNDDMPDVPMGKPAHAPPVDILSEDCLYCDRKDDTSGDDMVDQMEQIIAESEEAFISDMVGKKPTAEYAPDMLIRMLNGIMRAPMLKQPEFLHRWEELLTDIAVSRDVSRVMFLLAFGKIGDHIDVLIASGENLTIALWMKCSFLNAMTYVYYSEP